MNYKFTKMHGAGNDYIYISCLESSPENPEALSQYVADRRFGIGSDGLVLILPSDIADFRMRIFNADGSEAMMCGNATRCIAKYVYENGLTDKTVVDLETNSGIKILKLDVDGGVVKQVTVDMGAPILTPKDIPIAAEGQNHINQPINIAGKEWNLTAVSMGNPHAVVFTEDVDGLDLESIGPKFEHNSLFPQRVNTEFIRVIDQNTLQMRVWERGSGETWACGTGACACVVAAVLCGHCKRGQPVMVHLRGGDLVITWTEEGTVLMQGGATTVCTGEVAFPPAL